MFGREEVRSVGLPRNSLLEAGSVEDIVRSGLFKQPVDPDPGPIRAKLYATRDPSLPKETLVADGSLRIFYQGLLFMRRAAPTSPGWRQLGEILSFQPLAAGIEALLPGIGLIPSVLLHNLVESKLFPGERVEPPKLEEVDELLARSLVAMPYVDVVAVEEHLRRGKTRFFVMEFLTKEAERSYYTVEFRVGVKPGWAPVLLQARRTNEITQMYYFAVQDLFTGPLLRKLLTEPDPEMTQAEFFGKLEAAFKRDFTPEERAEICRAQLTMLTELLPYYRQEPSFREWVQALEACGAGTGPMPQPAF